MVRLAWLFALVLASAGCDKKEAVRAEAPADAGRRVLTADDLDFRPLVGLPEHGSAPAPRAAPEGSAAPTGSSAAPSEATGARASAVTLKQAGAEPRAPMRYAFAVGKPDTVVANFKTTVREEGGGAAPQGAQPPVRLTMSVVGVEPAREGVTKFALRIVDGQLVTKGMNVPPEAERQLAAVASALTKLSATFLVDARGGISDVQFGGGGPDVQRIAGELLPLLSQAIEMLFTTLPDDAVGAGAQWTTRSEGAPGVDGGQMQSTYTLKERTADGAQLHVDTERVMPAQPVPDPRAPAGSTMELKAKGSYEIALRLGGPAQKVTGDAETRVVLKDPTTKPPRSLTTLLKVSQTLETTPGAAAAPPRTAPSGTRGAP